MNERLGKIVKDSGHEFISDGIAHIITDKVHEQIIVDPEFDEPLSLKDCHWRALEIIGNDYNGIITVVFEFHLNGVIFTWGNYDRENWYVTGTTIGFC